MNFTLMEELWFGDLEDTAEQKAADSMVLKVAEIHGLKPFPIGAEKLITATRDPNYSVENIERIIEGDPALATRVLRVVNSAAYAKRVDCRSVAHAVVLLGSRTLGEIATAIIVLDMFTDTTGHAARLLEHSVVVGSLARQLAMLKGLPSADLYTCGLLHDLGKLLLLQCSAPQEVKDYYGLLDDTQGEFDVAYLRERESVGYDHAVVAGHILRSWKIPEPVPMVVAWHHAPGLALKEGPNVARMVNLIRLADRLGHALSGENNGTEEVLDWVEKDGAANYLEIGPADVEEHWTFLLRAFDDSRQILSM